MYRASKPSFPSTLEHLITSKRNAKIQQDVGPVTCHRRVCFSLVVPQFVAIPMKSCGVVHCRGCHPEPQHLASPPTSLRTLKFIFTGANAHCDRRRNFTSESALLSHVKPYWRSKFSRGYSRSVLYIIRKLQATSPIMVPISFRHRGLGAHVFRLRNGGQFEVDAAI